MTREEFEEQLNIRNENTKVWIQAETQTREYSHKLEKEVAHLTPFKNDCLSLQNVISFLSNKNIYKPNNRYDREVLVSRLMEEVLKEVGTNIPSYDVRNLIWKLVS